MAICFYILLFYIFIYIFILSNILSVPSVPFLKTVDIPMFSAEQMWNR